MYRVPKKGVTFRWGPEQTEAMDNLNRRLFHLRSGVLRTIDYAGGAGNMYLGGDSSLEERGASATLSQNENKRKHFIRYQSGME